MAQAQTMLLDIAERKGMSPELRAQLAKGISDLYTNSYNLVFDSLKKLIDDPTKIYLNNRRFYFAAIAALKMKEEFAEKFTKTGEGYGKQIAFLGLAVECLNSASKDLNKAAHLVDINEFNSFKSGLEQTGTEMYEKNRRIYFDTVPEMSALPKVEKLIKVFPLQLPDDLTNPETAKSLEGLVPREVKPMIMSYKEQMMNYISEQLDKYENEGKGAAFLNDLNLPHSLEAATSSNEISDSLWKRISEIQQKGGTTFLTGQINTLEKKAEEIEKRMQDMELALYVRNVFNRFILERRTRR
jgi:hypothetical protein